MRKNAFTLAEVLITLGIIGVVAVLTLPNLISDYRKKTYVAQLQRVYNQIQTAAQNCMADEDVDNLNDTYLKIGNGAASFQEDNCYDDNGDYDVDKCNAGYTDSSAVAGRFLKKYFRVTKDCGQVERNCECRSRAYKTLSGGSQEPNVEFRNVYCVNINTGASICMSGFGGYEQNLAPVWIDTNGSAGPNAWGRDVFEFFIDGKGDIVDAWDTGESVNGGYSTTCVMKIMSDGWKMDY